MFVGAHQSGAHLSKCIVHTGLRRWSHHSKMLPNNRGGIPWLIISFSTSIRVFVLSYPPGLGTNRELLQQSLAAEPTAMMSQRAAPTRTARRARSFRRRTVSIANHQNRMIAKRTGGRQKLKVRRCPDMSVSGFPISTIVTQPAAKRRVINCALRISPIFFRLIGTGWHTGFSARISP
jgi:hypothetical protein